jgi:hypothetical protein
VVPTLLYRVRTAYALLWVQEALDVLPFSWDDLGDVAWETLNRSLSQAFGTDKAHWTIALGLLETWSATLPELIDTTNMLV